MKKIWYVVDAREVSLSWDTQHDRGEQFKSERAALNAAKKLAEAEPHTGFHVCAVTHNVFVQTKPVEVHKV